MVETSEKVSTPSSSTSYARKDLEFFKVYLPEFSSRELVIPQAFINILEKPLPNEVLLVDEIGRLWHVETKTEDGEERVGVAAAALSKKRVGDVVFNKGWDKFANDQSLEFGDFLLFKYDGGSRFAVTIFAKHGCKKDLVVVKTAERSRVTVEKEPVIVKPVDVSIKPERWEGCGKRVMPNRKRVSVKEEPSAEVEPEYRRNTRRKVNRDRVDPGEMPWVPKKEHEGCEESGYKPKNPHFVRNITRGSLHQLEIPTTFLKVNGIEMEEDEDIELCDEYGKKWPLKIEKHSRGRRFSHDSWLCFCKSHKLSKPDKCLFEFVVTSNGTCNRILVRIYRERLLTIATKSGYQVLAM